MSSKFSNEKSKKLQSEFNGFAKIQDRLTAESIDDKGIQMEEFQPFYNGKVPHKSSNNAEDHMPAGQVIESLSSIFGDSVRGNFESYRRAGKCFFRCEHNEGQEYSQLMKSLLKTLIEKKMGKTTIHYIITPNSASAVFR